MSATLDADFVVVGAGVSGLTAAYELVRGGASVRVLEASDRVGGRTWSEPLLGTVVDRGGEWLSPEHARTQALCRDLDIELVPTTPSRGARLLRRSGELLRYSTPFPPLGVRPLVGLGRLVLETEIARRRIRILTPESARGAQRLDRLSVDAWLRARLGSEAAFDLMETAMRAVFCGEPDELSLLYLRFFLASHGGLLHLTSAGRGAQQYGVVGGAQEISCRLMDSLSDCVTLAAPVESLHSDDGGVAVATSSFAVRARAAIVALPPLLAAKLDVRPSPAPARSILVDRLRPGRSLKIHLVYERPFWRDEGLSGEAVSCVPPISATFDCTPASGAHAVLLGFVRGRQADAIAKLDENARRSALLEAVAVLFGPEGRKPLALLETAWAQQPWAGCCHTLFPPGALTSSSLGALREPVGRVHWAGTETSEHRHGYIEGAVLAGERAASEVLARF